MYMCLRNKDCLFIEIEIEKTCENCEKWKWKSRTKKILDDFQINFHSLFYIYIYLYILDQFFQYFYFTL